VEGIAETIPIRFTSRKEEAIKTGATEKLAEKSPEPRPATKLIIRRPPRFWIKGLPRVMALYVIYKTRIELIIPNPDKPELNIDD